MNYDMGMMTLERYMETCLSKGHAHFVRQDALAALESSPQALNMALMRQTKKGRLASPRRGFYLILRPEDRAIGAPDPARWIGPLMKYLGVDYRVALLRAASFHGASHQASMVFQVIAPKQYRKIDLGRHRVEFVYQNPSAFGEVNRPEWLDTLKTEAGFAKVSGIELTLLDCVRYFTKSGGINSVAQLVKDLGGKAQAGKLIKLASFYENASVRRLGYLLEHLGHARQAHALRPFAMRAKTSVPLDPSSKPIIQELGELSECDPRWKLAINETVETDF